MGTHVWRPPPQPKHHLSFWEIIHQGATNDKKYEINEMFSPHQPPPPSQQKKTDH